MPPYVVLTNRQLVEIVMKRPASRTALAGLDGIGTAKVERYGGEILTLLGSTPAASAATASAAPPPAASERPVEPAEPAPAPVEVAP